jgi:glucose 1-dehydrogenase
VTDGNNHSVAMDAIISSLSVSHLACAAAFAAGAYYAHVASHKRAQPPPHHDNSADTCGGGNAAVFSVPPAGQMLQGRVVVVTGASSGIGREIALLCASHGAHVLVMDLQKNPIEGGPPTTELFAQRVAQHHASGEGEVVFFKGDTSVAEGGCEAAAQEAVRRWGRLDVWVNNAAIGVGGSLLDTSIESWDKVLGVNARGYFLGCKAAVAQFLRQPPDTRTGLRGRVINITSQHGMVCCPGDIAYGVGKAAAVYMTRQVAVDYAASGIACNAVAPGKIITGYDTDVREYSVARTPCPRLGTPADVAQAVLFLASDMASAFITGTNLMVDGGWMAY